MDEQRKFAILFAAIVECPLESVNRWKENRLNSANLVNYPSGMPELFLVTPGRDT